MWLWVSPGVYSILGRGRGRPLFHLNNILLIIIIVMIVEVVIVVVVHTLVVVLLVVVVVEAVGVVEVVNLINHFY